MTDDLALAIERIAALQRVGFPLGSRHRSFARSLAGKRPADLSPAQRAHVARLAWRYRRQMPAHLVPPSDPDAAAPCAAQAPPAPALSPPGAEPAAPTPPDLFSL